MNPLQVHELRPVPDPADVCAALEGLPHRIFLDSAAASGKYARYSFVAADPVSVITAKGTAVEARNSDGSILTSTKNIDPLDRVREILSGFSYDVPAGLPPFQGGAAGYIGYEFGSGLEGIPAPALDDLSVPDLCVGIYDTVFSWDHATGQSWLASRSSQRLSFFLQRLGHSPPRESLKEPGASRPAVSSLSRDEYRRAIGTIREYIAAGDIFQANFAQRFKAGLNISAWDLYLALRKGNPAPFACFFEGDGMTLASVSPERFIKVDERKHAETRPIKGTRPRMPGRAADEQAKAELSASEKDNAEHVMIVDVLRNDLSRVCEPGSVIVSALAEQESHPTVHHLVSTITGTLKMECDSIDLLRASIPGGSITGAPKVRAMEIIAELEPVRRDAYCGCVLYLTPDGVMDSNIVIRTFLVQGQSVFFSAGGGIVADSDPDLEFEETLHKAAALFTALELVS